MPLTDLITNTKRILGIFPNTYTYTKNLCERLMKRRRGSVPLTIVRPAIITTSYEEPFPGWTDSLAAAAALFMFIGLGIVKVAKGDMKKIGDIIPVDVVVAAIIVATASNVGNLSMPIYHVGTSDLNPLAWSEMKDDLLGYWNSTVSASKMGKADIVFTTNDTIFKLEQLKRRIPIMAYKRLSPLLGKSHEKLSTKMLKTLKRGEEVSKLFEFFMSNEWIYECRNIKKLAASLTPQERSTFFIEIADIESSRFIKVSNYGVQKYLLNEEAESPLNPNSNLLTARPENTSFSDIKWAYKTQMPVRPINEVQSKILSSSRVLKAMEE